MKRLLRLLCRRRAALLPLAVLLASETAWAQQEEEGPVYGVRRRGPAFGIDPIRGALVFQSQYVNNTAKATIGGQQLESTVLSFRELLDLATRGYVVHPNLLEFNLAGSIGLEQTSVENPLGSSDSDSTIYQWNMDATFLRNQDFTATLYTRQLQSLVNQPFGETYNSTDTSYGASINWKSKTLPTSVQAYRTETVQSSLTGEQSFTLNQNVLEWDTDLILSDHHGLSWNYNYTGTDQTSGTGGSASYEVQTEALSHHIGFGSGYRHDLTSTVVLSQIAGVFPRDSMRWDEMLHLRHTPNFETAYTYSLNQESGDNVDQEVQTASASFRHRLYRSLTTRGLLRYSELQLSEESATETLLASLDFNYQKKVPYGTLYADLGLLYNQQQNQTRNEELAVLNQPINFSGFTPVIIQRSDIVPGSVKLHNATGFFFSPISDYRVSDRGSFVEVQRQPASLFIHEGDSVLADFLLEPEPATTTTTEALAIGSRYNIEKGPLAGLTPYVQYYLQDQSFDAAGPTLLRADQIQDLRMGAEYFYKEFMFRGEYQIHDSTLLPFEAMRFQARWNRRFGADTTLQMEGRYEVVSYSDPPDEQTIVSASASASHRFTRQLRLTASVDWFSTQDDLAGSTEGLQEQLELSWRHRQLEVFMRLRNSSLQNRFQEETFQLFLIGIRREF